MRTISINDNGLEQIHRNLYKYGEKHFRLFAIGTTPNGCWLIAPILVEVVDIDIPTGKDVYGPAMLAFDGATGTVQVGREFISYELPECCYYPSSPFTPAA